MFSVLLSVLGVVGLAPYMGITLTTPNRSAWNTCVVGVMSRNMRICVKLG